jgi:N-acyl homoserine lactone hydrolase
MTLVFSKEPSECIVVNFPRGAIVMLGPTKVAVSFVLVALSLMMEGTITNAESKLPDLINADVAEKLFRLDCGRSLANDESVWTPGETSDAV